jgi:N-acetylglucosamine-6-phosphate deacetylase
LVYDLGTGFPANHNPLTGGSMLLRALALICAFIAPLSLHAWQEASTRHQEGLQENRPDSFVLQGARVVVRPGTVIDDATLVIRDGRIVSVRGSGDWPADHRLIDLTGKTVYPGFIDGYSEQEIVISEAAQHTRYWNANIRPERDMQRLFGWGDGDTESLRENGITAVLAAPREGIFRGQAALVLATETRPENGVVAGQVAQCSELTVQRRFGGPRIYPSSPMGAVALARQALYDARWYTEAWNVASRQTDVNRPETNLSLQTLAKVLSGEQPLLVKTSNELMVLRADRFAREFGIDLMIVGNGNEYRRLQEIARLDHPLILPVDFAAAPAVGTPEDALDVTLEALMHWDLAPENPAMLEDAGIEFAFTAHGLDDLDDFLKRIRQAVTRGLSADAALAALTTVPARYFGADRQLGSIETGKLANLVITDGELFDQDTKILETWVVGERYEHQAEPVRKVGGTWSLKLADDNDFVLRIDQQGSRLSGQVNPESGDAAETADPAADQPAAASEPVADKAEATGDPSGGDRQKPADEDAAEDAAARVRSLILVGSRLSGTFTSDAMGHPGTAQFSLIVAASNEAAAGYVVWPDGTRQAVSAALLSRQEATGP